MGCDLPSKGTILVGVCLALRSRKLLNPTQIKGYWLKKPSPPTQGQSGVVGKWKLGLKFYHLHYAH